MKYRHGSHTKYNIEYHFVWATKYRYQVLTGDVGFRVRELIRQTCEELDEVVSRVSAIEKAILGSTLLGPRLLLRNGRGIDGSDDTRILGAK